MRAAKIRTMICIRGKQEITVISFYWLSERIQSGIEMYPFCKRKLNRGRGRKHHKSCFKVKDALKSSVTCLNSHGFTFQPYDWSIISTA